MVALNQMRREDVPVRMFNPLFDLQTVNFAAAANEREEEQSRTEGWSIIKERQVIKAAKQTL